MARKLLRFDGGTLDIAARELVVAGGRVELPPTVFDCIAYLATHRERAVGRDELVSAVWGRSAISDTMLGKAILAARRALGDTAEAQAVLRTVPRFGYRWVAPVVEAEADGDVRLAASAPPDPAPPPANAPADPPPARRRPFATVLALLAVAALAAMLLLAALRTRDPAGRPPDAPSPPGDAATDADALAVLPADVFAGSEDGWLRLGLMDLLATRLREAGLVVMPSDSVVRAIAGSDGRDEAMGRLAGAGGPRAFALPSVRRSGARWIVRIELVAPGGAPRVAQAEGDSAISATGAAARRVLALLGRGAPDDVPDGDIGLTELLQRTDAARLSENLALARALIDRAPAALRDRPEVRERAVRIDLRAGRFDAAREALDALLARASAESEPLVRARLLENLCVANLRSQRLADARAACDEAIRLLDGRDDAIALGRAYNDRGILNAREGRVADALADFSHSRVALALGGDPLLMAQLDGNESTVQMAEGRPAEALPALVRAGELFRRFGLLNEFAVAVVNRIGAHLQLLQPVEALKAGDDAWAERERITDPQVRDAFAVARADSLAAVGRLAEARALLDATIRGDRPQADPAQAARARAIEARLDLALGDAATAAVLARQAVDGLAGAGDEADRADAWVTWLRALRRDDPDAARELAAFAAWAERRADPRVRVRLDVARAETAAATGATEAAVSAYEAALAGTGGRTELIALVATSYGGFLIAQGRLDDAATIAGRVARSAEQDFDCALLQVRLYHALGREGPWKAALALARATAGERRIPEPLLRPAGAG